VLPLKLRFPERFDGVALVLGAAAPDLGYVLAGIAEPPSHAWHSLLWFNLPVVLLAAVLVRRAAPAVAAHLPRALRDYGVLASVRHPWRVTAWSAVLGALSHQVWDAVTHPYMLFFSPSAFLPALHATAFGGLPWWRVVHLVSEALGTIVTGAALVHIGRRRLLVRWHGAAPSVVPRPRMFWPVLAVTFGTLTALFLLLPGNGVGIWIPIARTGVALAVAVLAAAESVRGGG